MLILSNILSALISSSLFFHSLPSESTGINVRAVCQDSYGNMWFGGQDGITLYDGSRYTDFRHIAGGPGSPSDDHIYKLICDSEGAVWATHLSGLSVYNPASNAFRNYRSPDGAVTELLQLSGSGFLAVINSRLWLFDKGSGAFSRDGIPQRLMDFPANVIYEGGDGIFLGGLDGRVFSVSRDLQTVQEISTGIGSFKINCFLLDESSLWVGTEGIGLWEIPLSGVGGRNYPLELVRALCKDEEGGLWIGTKNGLYVLRDGKLDVFHHDYFDKGSITHDSVHEIFRDKQGTIWLGTYYGGVCYCTSHPSLFFGIVSRPGDNFLNGNVISDIVEGADGSLWIGTNSGGLNHMRKDGTFEHIKGGGDDSSDLPDIKSILVSKYSGKVFVGSDKGRLAVLSPGGKQLRAFGSSIRNGSYAIAEKDDADGFYAGTPNGLFEYTESTGAFREIPVPGSNSNIYSLKLSSDGILWVGKKFGVVAIDSSTGEPYKVPEELAEIRYAEDFLEDASGRIWISSSDGLFCYDPAQKSLRTYTTADGLPDNVIHGVEEDAGGRLWISTNRGLCRFDPSTGEKWVFTVADGLPGDRFTRYAHCRTQSGEMYFGGLSWIVRFNPEAINPTYKEVSPILSGMEVNGAWRPLSGDSVDLRPKERDISIIFSAPDYLSGQNGHFFYKLEGSGIKDTWHEAGMDRKATYHGLEKGSYTFHLNYRNSAGIRSPEEILLHIKIPPYWYETAGVRIIFVLLIAFLAIFFVLRLLAQKKAEYQTEMEKVRNELLSEFSLEFVRIGANKSAANESSVAKVFYKGDEEFMRKAMQVVKKNLDNPEFSVESLAAEMNMSRSNLHIRSKALFGVSAHEFIKTVRFNEACRLLLEKKHSVAEIGYMVGFTTPSYFASAFHRFIGCTPTEYIARGGK